MQILQNKKYNKQWENKFNQVIVNDFCAYSHFQKPTEL
jgi:hypothetical protein